MKPNCKNETSFERRKIVHFHGMKPHEIMKGLMGHKRDYFAPAERVALPTLFGNAERRLPCLALRDFAVSIAEDPENLDLFCETAFFSTREEGIGCKDFLRELSKREEGFDCAGLLKSRGFVKDKSLTEHAPEA